jgi:hypothetical protein
VFFCNNSEDVAGGIFIVDAKDSFLSSFFGHATELCYQCQATVTSTRCSFCFAAQSHEAQYCDTVLQCKNVFGCVGLRQKQYCILNKQYTKEEFERLRTKLIEQMKTFDEWGEFLPKEMGCFAYNESTAQEFFPLTKEEVLAKGFRWRETEKERIEAERIIPAARLPDAITDIPDDVLNWAIRCAKTDRLFRIIKQELDFYRTHNIPLPRLHSDERYADRMAAYCNPTHLYDRTCMNCKKPLRQRMRPTAQRLCTVNLATLKRCINTICSLLYCHRQDSPRAGREAKSAT